MELFNGRINVSATRWPWQAGYNWRGMATENPAPGNPEGARFGGGWKYCLGVRIAGFSRHDSLYFELLFGMIRVGWDFRKRAEIEKEKAEWAELKKTIQGLQYP